MAESFSREKLMHRRKKVDEKSRVTFLLWDPGWCTNELDVQNEWEENTHTQYRGETIYYPRVSGRVAL